MVPGRSQIIAHVWFALDQVVGETQNQYDDALLRSVIQVLMMSCVHLSDILLPPEGWKEPLNTWKREKPWM